MAQPSAPILCLSAVYMGSRSMRVGITWLFLVGFCAEETETFIDLFDRMGVERLMDGRLRAAGLISTIL